MTYLSPWIFVISGSCAAIGFWAYTLEVIRGNVKRTTRWKDLDDFQFEMWFLAHVGGGVFLLALIIEAILKA